MAKRRKRYSRTLKMFWRVFFLISCIKLLLIPSYRSTDFEVHRNWLAITHSLPLREWYTDATSEWTLDYPPFFAWFEGSLSYVAKYFDPEMLEVQNLNYSSAATVLFQRLSVIVMDLVYAYGVKECVKSVLIRSIKASVHWNSFDTPEFVAAVLLLGNAGLLLVDHIHFQYNGFLFGMQLISIARIVQGRPLEASLWFATLLNFKHIYLYVAPAYFVYLLGSYCFQKAKGKVTFSFLRLIQLGSIVCLVFGVSLGPFVALEQFPQVLSRLFPFKRGLCHAYWAPNFWALYNVADKSAVTVARLLQYPVPTDTASMTGGLVQEYSHTVLPSISPKITFLLVALSMLPAIVKLWIYSGKRNAHLKFVHCVTLCAFGSFLFGWHVHEKAVLLIVVPLTLLSVVDKQIAGIYLLLSTVGHFSLFPLIYTSFELPIKVLLLLLNSGYAFQALQQIFYGKMLLNNAETAYLLGLVPLFLYKVMIHRLLDLQNNLPFLPLMMVSTYCAVGIIYCWVRLYARFIFSA